MPVRVTYSAAAAVKGLLDSQEHAPDQLVRLNVGPEGELTLSLDVKREGDQVVSYQGSPVMVAHPSVQEALSSVMVHVEETPEGLSLTRMEAEEPPEEPPDVGAAAVRRRTQARGGAGVAVQLGVDYPEDLSRPRLFVKWLLAIPLYVVLIPYGIGAGVGIFIAFWAILFTGRYPDGMFDFVRRYMNFSFRVFSYFPLLMTDHWSPDDDHPLWYDTGLPAELSRQVLVFLKLPSFLFYIVYFLSSIGILVLGIVAIPVWCFILLSGKYPRGLFEFNVSLLQWVARVMSWQYLMRDEGTLFGTTDRVKALVGVGVVVAVVLIGFGVVAGFASTASSGLEPERNEVLERILRGMVPEYDEAIRRHPEDAKAWSARSDIYLYLRQPQRAIKDLDEAIRLEPQFAEAYANRALAYTLLGQEQEATQDAERAIELGFDRSILESLIEGVETRGKLGLGQGLGEPR